MTKTLLRLGVGSLIARLYGASPPLVQFIPDAGEDDSDEPLSLTEMVADFDDRVLAHLQVTIIATLRRGGSFTFSWNDAREIGSGRTSIWLGPGIPLSFRFFGSRPPQIDRLWAEHLTQTANSSGGLRIVPEPSPITIQEPHR